LLFTLDDDIAEKLRKEGKGNQSKLVNDLLSKFFSNNPHVQESQIQEELKEIETEHKEILKKNVNFTELSRKLVPRKAL
jgi:hypothetical protein